MQDACDAGRLPWGIRDGSAKVLQDFCRAYRETRGTMEFHKGFWTASLGIVGLMGGLGYVDHVRSSQFMDNEAALLADADRHCLPASGVSTPGAFAPGVFSASTFSGERTCAEKKRYAVKSSPAAPAGGMMAGVDGTAPAARKTTPDDGMTGEGTAAGDSATGVGEQTGNAQKGASARKGTGDKKDAGADQAAATAEKRRTQAAENFRALQEARDYRVLFESLLAHPNDVSGFYASYILNACGEIRWAHEHDTHTVLPPTSSQQEEARQLMSARCASFAENELPWNRQPPQDRDPRLVESYLGWPKPGTGLNMPFSPEDRAQEQQAILAAQDPIVLEAYGVPKPPEDRTRYPWVPAWGSDSDSAKGTTWVRAWYSAMCEATKAPCGRGDRFVLARCAQDGYCVDSRQQLMRDEVLADEGEAEARRFDALVAGFVEAYRQR